MFEFLYFGAKRDIFEFVKFGNNHVLFGLEDGCAFLRGEGPSEAYSVVLEFVKVFDEGGGGEGCELASDGE